MLRKIAKKKSSKRKVSKKTFNPNFKIFDRDQFYKEKLLYINKNIVKGKVIKVSDFDKFNKKSGIFAKWGRDEKGRKICLDVSQSYDIGKELSWTNKAIIKGYKSQDLSNEEIRNSKHRNPNKYIKYRNVASYSPIEYRLVKINVAGKENREQIEMEYAHKYKAKFWYPCPGKQQKKTGHMIKYSEYVEKYK